MNKIGINTRAVLIFFSLLIVLVAANTIQSVSEYNKDSKMTPQEIIEYDDSLAGSQYTGAIKEAVCTLKIDKLPVFIYLDKDNTLDIVLFDGGVSQSRTTNGFNVDILNNGSLTDCAWRYDNKNGNRVVWGVWKANDKNEITVNGKAVSSVKLYYSINGQKVSRIFWYSVFKGKPDYKIKEINKALI